MHRIFHQVATLMFEISNAFWFGKVTKKTSCSVCSVVVHNRRELHAS